MSTVLSVKDEEVEVDKYSEQVRGGGWRWGASPQQSEQEEYVATMHPAFGSQTSNDSTETKMYPCKIA
jgi:hypothetical protein